MAAKAVVKNVDMPPDMLEFAIKEATIALDSFNTEKEVAQAVRNAFVKSYNGVWHCMVGTNFGAFSTYEESHFVYFYVGQTAVLLFKTG
eukprot:CAMPEP_0174697030 /NCGR_PEP_ID=MMETSP1094-20130205/3004_1 /TAXON_ID=156173 /ORGANISM="Chrysochromulina brevifilum, Strain UTEX LB 985" /LENGTH=88 /DNA_ID=CAMNT_0015893923 /DNA_START=75 /DNA_END=341 /DNA_ORIENTATION=+